MAWKAHSTRNEYSLQPPALAGGGEAESRSRDAQLTDSSQASAILPLRATKFCEPQPGRPKSATFRTADVVGLDILAHVINTMRDTLPDDPWHKYYAVPGWLQTLVDKGALGQKSKRGVYQKVGKEIHVLDIEWQEYVLSAGEA